MGAMFAHIRTQMTFVYWRLKRGRRCNALKIASFLRRHPGASVEQITDYVWACIPLASRRNFDQSTEPELNLLARYRVIENRSGWQLTNIPDPFAKLVETIKDESQLVDAFGELAVHYSGTIERRLAAAIATFLADSNRREDMRRFAYISFLQVIGISVNRWPKPDVLMSLAVPDDFDWSIINVFFPKSSRRTIA